MSAKISIIMPVYNAEKTIEETLRSLENQTYSDIEIICVNDGSKDKSLEILQNHASIDGRIIVLSQENASPAAARNAALSIAQGEYLMFCDSDDKYEPQMCQRMFETIEEKKVDLVMCDTEIEVATKSLRTKASSALEYNRLNMFNEVILDNSTRPNVRVTLWNKIFRKKIVDDNQIIFPKLYTTEDDAFVLIYISLIEKAYGLDEKLYHYIVRGDSLTDTALHKNNKNAMNIFYSLHYVMSYLSERNLLGANIIWLLFVINKCLYMRINLVDASQYEKIFGLVKDILVFTDYETVAKSGYKLLTYIRSNDYQKYFSFIKNQGAESFLQKFFSLKNFGNKKVLKIFGLGFSFDRD